ncbi:MAG: hypothetical protein MR939_05210 [Clostridiales bacterium]|nr:hypothetical protein [Clostridiales bacterium]MDD7387268.1 hypothetical protein [Bacillota bacterium]MDY6040786.1 hypothetical protein [Candidatus Faecousia sp.]
MAAKRKRKYEFKPDPSGTNFWKKFYMTRLQRLTLLKWTLYSLLCVALLVIQDSMLSRMHLWGATTDLAAAVILLIGIHEGAENGGLFTLIASAVYWFSGSAPAPYAIVILTFLVVGISLLRQMFWRRSFGSTMLCTGLSIIIYEMAVFLIGVVMGLTIWDRAGVFFLTALFSLAFMLPMHWLVSAIGKIGGDSWKE